MDYNGNAKYSNIVVIRDPNANPSGIISVYPNPATTIVNAAINSISNDKLTIIITDINGKIVAKRIENIKVGNNIITVDIRSLASGTYILKAISESNSDVSSSMFIKQ